MRRPSSVIRHSSSPRRGDRDRRRVRTWIIVGGVVLVLGLFLSQLYAPFVLDIQESREARALQQHLKAVQRENRRLERRLEDVETPRGLEVEARAWDMVREGEVPFRVQGVQPDRSAGGSASGGQPEGPVPLSVRVSRLGAETAAWFGGVIGQLFGQTPDEG